MDSGETRALRERGYVPQDFVAGNDALGEALDMLDSGFFTPDDADAAKPVVNRLLGDGEPFLVLADFAAYAAAQERVDALFRLPDDWSRRAAINTLSMGTFSSDRSIREYADSIWDVRPVI
jgi:starch phosphorylase